MLFAHLTLASLFLLSAWQNPASLFEQALQMQQAGDYKGAEQTYRQFLKLKPELGGAYVNLGVVLVKQGRYDEAIKEYEEALRLIPGDPGIVVNIALAYSKSGRPREAAEKLESVHNKVPSDRRITMLLADTRLQLGEDKSVIDLLKPLAGDDDLAIAYMLGTAYLRTNQLAEGQTQLDRILSKGDSAEAGLLLGTRMFLSGDYPNALKQFEKAAAVNPNLPELQAYYGQALLLTGDPEAAAQAFRKELASNPNNYRANLALGQILASRKQYLEGLPLLSKASALRPESSEAHEALGGTLLHLGRLDEARRNLEEAKKSGANFSDLHENLAAVYTPQHRPADASRERAIATRLRNEAAAKNPDIVPKLGTPAPDFSLPNAVGAGDVKLSSFKSKSPVVLVFGSYSCPNFRGSAAALRDLQTKYGTKLPFLLVYIREAHTDQNWQSTRNVRESISVKEAQTLAERQDHAVMCRRELHLAFPAVVDNLDGAVEAAYKAWPSRTVIVGKDGRVLYNSRLTEWDFRPADMESILRQISVPSAK